MRFDRIIVGAAFSFAIVASTGASAFEKTQMGGTNPDGSTANYQDPDEQPLPSPLGGTPFQQGSGTSQSSQNQTFQWTVTPDHGSAEAKSGFNEPLLRERP